METILAMFVFGAGCLSLVAGQTALTRLRNRSSERLEAAGLAISVLDSLRTAPCPALAPGSRATPRARVTWSVLTGIPVATLTITAQPASGQPWTARTIRPCRP